MKEIVAAKAKERQGTRNDIVEILPESEKIQTRDELGALADLETYPILCL